MLLLDEPLGALDKKLREETQFELIDLQQKLGLTFVIVTHDQEEAMTVADRIAVMDQGKIIQVATPAEIYEQPNSRFVADFIGDVNLFEGQVVERANGGRVESLPGTGATSSVDQRRAAARRRGRLVRHPAGEDRDLARRSRPTGDVNCVAGEVWDIGYLGDVSIYHVRLPSGATVKATVTNRTRLVERPITWDDKVWLSWPRDAGVVLTR